MLRFPPLLVLVALALALSACGSDSAPPLSPADLSGRAFVATSVVGHAADTATAVAPRAIQLVFDGTRLSVATGCNDLSGSYTLHGAVLRLPSPATTMMGCPPAREAQQVWLAALLNNGLSTGLSGDQMTLTSHGTTIHLTERTKP